jgi:hypothetical protein
MTFPSILDVPTELQEDDFSCVPVCIKMILEFVRRGNPGGFIPNLSVEEISIAMSTDELGTRLSAVEGINAKLQKSVPSIEFESKTNCTFSDIENEIQQGKPVIAWLRMPHPHSIVIEGFDKTKLIVFYNDPQVGKRQMEMGRFMSSWDDMDNVLIKAKIGEKLQRVIPEFIEISENAGEQK